MKRHPYNPQFAAPIKSRRDRFDEAVERDNQVAARRTREYEAAQARETLPAAEDKIACAVPPAGWHCTRKAGHSGPCAAYPTPPEAPASAPAAPHAPAGWKLVPVEPTEAMVHAAEDIPAPRPFGKVYRAMLATAPAPHAQAEPVYQVKFLGHGSEWHDASAEAYHTFRPERRRILYTAPVPQEAEQAAPAAVTDERARFEKWAAGNVTSLVQGKFGTGYVYSMPSARGRRGKPAPLSPNPPRLR
jgi:hypothetical protein